MPVLALNLGSSSLKFRLFSEAGQEMTGGMVDGIGRGEARIRFGGETRQAPVATHAAAFSLVLEGLRRDGLADGIERVVHRVVHGGERYARPTQVDEQVIADIRDLAALSPLHNPLNLQGILLAREALPSARHIAVFDTAFYAGLSPKAYLYGIPFRYYEKYRIRKYGFHGISHSYLASQILSRCARRPLRHISCHLGNGSSITAIVDGKPLDTTMGFSPLQGLMMGTRSGTIDPSIIAFLEEKEGLTAREVENMLNKRSGILGLSEISSDVRDIYQFAKLGDDRARLTLDIMGYQLRRFIGEMIAVLGGADVISFTAGIGENAFYLRKAALDGLQDLGIMLDDDANFSNAERISATPSRTEVLVLRTDEERAMFEQVKAMTENG